MDHCKISDSNGKPVQRATDERIQSLWNSVLDECAAKQQQQHEQQQEPLKVSPKNNSHCWEESLPACFQHVALAAATVDDSRGETSEESNGEGSSSAGSDVPENFSAGERHMHASTASDGLRDGETAPSKQPVPAQLPARHPMSNASQGLGFTSKGKERSGENDEDGSLDDVKLGEDTQATKKKPVTKTPVSLGHVLEETARTRLANLSKAELELWGWHRGNLEISCGAVSSAGIEIRMEFGWRGTTVRTAPLP